MIKFEFNGKPFDPRTFEEQLLREAMNQVAEEMHQTVTAIRHPLTGEFPTVIVRATSLKDMSLHIEGSPELLALVSERLGTTPTESGDFMTHTPIPPKVFLSWGWEDKALAEPIAQALQAQGINTWWSEWCINAGESLRQKIDEGLSDCTHFIVLLTKTSIHKPWVNREIDAGFALNLSNKKVKFIGLRHGLQVADMPPLLQGMLCPEVNGITHDLTGLVNEIHGVIRKPPLGSPPVAVQVAQQSATGYSPAATAIAKFFCDTTKFADFSDEMVSEKDLSRALQLSSDDVADALHELRAFIKVILGHVQVAPELFAAFDKFWRTWNPEEDAIQLAKDLVQDPSLPSSASEIAARYGWDARRLNPALSFLLSRKLIRDDKTLGSAPWVMHWVTKTDEARRFVRSRMNA